MALAKLTWLLGTRAVPSVDPGRTKAIYLGGHAYHHYAPTAVKKLVELVDILLGFIPLRFYEDDPA